MLNPIDELFFWTGIMRDHSEFILTSLSIKEAAFVTQAQYFKNGFEVLNREVSGLENSNSSAAALSSIISISLSLLVNFIQFKRLILRRLLQCNIEISLPPTFVNHMINEALEFYKTLCTLAKPIQKSNNSKIIHLHKIWLPDAAGHAATISADLDPTEAALIKKSEEFKKDFNNWRFGKIF